MNKKIIYSLWVFGLLLLTLEILLPALNKNLWYDDLDLLLIGRAERLNDGVIDDAHAYPLHPLVINGEGKNDLFQIGWVTVNSWIDALEMPHGLWRTINVIFFVSALALYSFFRLKGLWLLAPLLLAFFSEFVFRSAGMVRNYNLSCLLFVGCLLLLQSSKRKYFWICLVALWQINLLTFICFAFLHFTHLITQYRQKNTTLKKLVPLVIFYVAIAVFQYTFNYRLFNNSHNNDLIPVFSSTANRLQIISLTFNNFVIPLILVLPLMLWKRDKVSPHFRYLLLFLLVLAPLTFPNFRAVYLIAFTPVLFVEFVKHFSHWPKIWSLPVMGIVILSTCLSYPFNQLINYKAPDHFYDQSYVGEEIVRRTPSRALFESQHRKWTEIDAVCHYIRSHKKEGDHILYEVSRDSIMAHLAWKDNMPTTALFPAENNYHKNFPNSLLSKARLPFWAVTPFIPGDNRTQLQLKEECLKNLKDYGQVTVHMIPKRTHNWIKSADYPPAEIAGPSDYIVYYVDSIK